MPIYIIFGELLGIITIIYNKMASRSLNLPYISIELFVNLLDVR
jgi:hypothetical protein